MSRHITHSILFFGLFYFPFFATLMAKHSSPARAVSESKFTKAHSLGDSYDFNPRDGWQAVNVSNLQYKYRRDFPFLSNATDGLKLSTRTTKKKPAVEKHLTNIPDMARKTWDSLKGMGKSEDVTITWYTGHDLLNPSCWPNSRWAPTDNSFACAVTLEGWPDRPQCLTFLELCNGPKKCVFVRVVDTCAGCAAGSKHVDLTKAAFGQLATMDIGITQVQMRPATQPLMWFENLWGPK